MPKPGAQGAAPRAAAAPAGTPAAGAGVGACPSCGEARSDSDARYCEVCRYDFVANKPGPPPAARLTPTPTPPLAPVRVPAAAPAAAPVAAAGASKQWELVVAVDPGLDVEPDPTSPCPTGVPEQVIPLDRDILVGRRDDRRDIRPELPLNDPGASRRHAKFVLNADGTPALQDLASTNGTKLNDVDTAPGSRTTLKEGDTVTLGRWTRITVRGRA
jgi:hypothetical protein